MQVSLRPPREAEIPRCVALELEVPEAIVRRKIAWEEVFIADVGGEAVGYLRLELLWSKIPFIGWIRVEEPWRRRGVGTAMVHALEERLRDQGHWRLMSSTEPNHAVSYAWHRSLGFQEAGFLARINPGGVGDVFFVKVISADGVPPDQGEST